MTTSVQSLERAFCLLELLAAAETDMAISELSRMSGLPLGTTHRLLDTLVQLQYVEHDAHSRRYALGPRILHLRAPTLDKHNLGMQAMPVMKALMQRVNETVHLAVLDGSEIVYIDRIEGLQTQGMYTRIGKHNTVHSTALGKAMMAFQPVDTVERIVRERGLPSFTPHTIADPEAFAAELEKVRLQGFSVDNEEGEIGVRCIAAPLRDYSGEVVAALSISGPTTRIRPSRDAELSEAVRWASQLISTRLGYLAT